MPSQSEFQMALHWYNASHLGQTLRSVKVAPKAGAEIPGIEMHTIPTIVVCLNGVVRTEFARSWIDLAANEALLIPLGTPHTHCALKPDCAMLDMGFMLGFSNIRILLGDEERAMAIPEQPARSHLEAAVRADPDDRLRLVRSALSQLRADTARPMEPMPEPTRRMWLYLLRKRMSPITSRDVLKASGLGLTQSHTMFRAYFRTTPLVLLRRNRVEYALHLIAQGHSADKAATASGFRNRRQLTAACRKVHGAPPTRVAGR